MKLYTSVINTYWECGDEKGNEDTMIGIFETPQKAYDAAMVSLYEQFEYDDKTDTFYSYGYADEAWAEVYEYEVNSAKGGDKMQKDSDGNWYNATKKLEKECIRNEFADTLKMLSNLEELIKSGKATVEDCQKYCDFKKRAVELESLIDAQRS